MDRATNYSTLQFGSAETTAQDQRIPFTCRTSHNRGVGGLQERPQTVRLKGETVKSHQAEQQEAGATPPAPHYTRRGGEEHGGGRKELPCVECMNVCLPHYYTTPTTAIFVHVC